MGGRIAATAPRFVSAQGEAAEPIHEPISQQAHQPLCPTRYTHKHTQNTITIPQRLFFNMLDRLSNVIYFVIFVGKQSLCIY